MALIICQTCGKQVSDRAKACPGCGAILTQETIEKNEPVICQECGFEIPAGSAACPNCGCPIDCESADDTEGVLQKVEESSVNLSSMRPKKRKGIIISLVAIAVVIAGVLTGIKLSNDKKAAEEARMAEEAARLAEEARIAEETARLAEEAAAYKSTLQTVSFSMIDGAAKAETAGNLILSVWSNAIYERSDIETDKYTKNNDLEFVDFNTALSNLLSDNSFSEKISEISKNQTLVLEYMKKLNNPPKGFEDAYRAAKDCYDAYGSFINIVINLSGSLQSFSSDFSDADSTFLNKYDTLQLYLD